MNSPSSRSRVAGSGAKRGRLGAAGELATAGRALPDDRRDLREVVAEHVMQQEDRALDRIQPFQHHQKREREGIGQRDTLGGIIVRAGG